MGVVSKIFHRLLSETSAVNKKLYFRDIRAFVRRYPLFHSPLLYRPKFQGVPLDVKVYKERTPQAN